jgi:cytochrome c6
MHSPNIVVVVAPCFGNSSGRNEMNHRMLRTASVVLQLFTLVLMFSVPMYAQDGPALYKTKCAACHDADGSGSGAMGKQLGAPDLRSDAVQKKTDAQLTDEIASGVGQKMPAYKGKLTDDQIKGLVAAIRGLKK